MRLQFILLLCFFSAVQFVQAQTQTPVYLSQTIPNANSKGFYRYLPADYTTSGKNYPLIIWVHGAGQVGQGNAAELPRILLNGLPKNINDGVFPASFVSGDSTFSFVIISPQFIAWPTGNNIAAIIDYAQANFRVNSDRIYLMGFSAGGGASWEFAGTSITNSNRLAAMIPFCGALLASQSMANNIAASKLPVWAFHNTNDGTIPVSYTRNWVSYINNYRPQINPLAKITEFTAPGTDAVVLHDCWSMPTLVTYKPAGLNLYEWLLQYKRRPGAPNIAPFAKAGDDATVLLPSSLILNGTASYDTDGNIISYKWRKISGPNSFSFSDSTASINTVQNLSAGTYSFELIVTDNQNAVGRDTLIATILPAPPPGTDKKVLIDAGPPTNAGGVLSGTPDTNGNYWNNMTDARVGDRVVNAKTTINTPTTISLEVINRIDGTYNTGGNGMNSVNSLGAVGIYPSSATNDYAFAHNSVTNGRWRMKGLDPTQTYTIKFWGTKSFETSNRDIEIKQSDETTWKSYSAASNTNFNVAAVFTITGKSVVDFDIRAKSPSVFGYINVIDITIAGTTIQNQPPVANAGVDLNLSLPQDSAMLSGCSSSDPENAALKYKWKKISGSAGVIISNDSICNPIIRSLTQGQYAFELMVTDTGNLSHKDTVAVSVNAFSLAWPTLPAPICAQTYSIVTLGSSTTFGTGATPIDSSWVNKMRLYMNRQNAQITVTNLGLGGITSYSVCPTDYIPPPNRALPDTLHNITAAIALHPDAIIINLPSNDVAAGLPLQESKDNLDRIVAEANANNIPVWVSTTQPKNGLSTAQLTSQMNLRDWIIQRYGNKSIDFWTTVANADGTINNTFSAGDGTHLNNNGHHLLFTRVLQEKIWDTICLRRIPINIPPIAKAGNDQVITLPATVVTVTGIASTDSDGTITNYSWRKYSGPAGGNIAAPSSIQTNITFTTSGVYGFELTVTDNNGAIGKDSVLITVNPPGNISPIARAGSDQTIYLPINTVTVTGTTSTDSDGTITNYSWRKYSGPTGGTIATSTSVQTSISFTTAGVYGFELTVTDNSGATGKDSVLITVSPNVAPISNAGIDQTIQLPVNTVFVNGRASTDANGSITSYSWTYVSGPAGSTIRTATKDTTTISFVNTGVYIFRLVVTDNGGLTGTDDIQVTVNAASTTTLKNIRVNIFNGSTPYTNTSWNNWFPSNGVTSSNFKYEDGSQSTVNANLSQYNLSDNGAGYAANATICPPEVLRFNAMHTIPRTLTVSGLTAGKTYHFEFYASRGFTSGSKSIFRSGTVADTIDTDFNIADYAKLNNLIADNTGKIIFNLGLIGTYQYLAGFTIIDPSTGRMMANQQKENNLGDEVDLDKENMVYPNPFNNQLHIRLPTKRDTWSIQLTDVFGRVISKKEFNTNGISDISIPTQHLQKGNYILSITSTNYRMVQKLIKL